MSKNREEYMNWCKQRALEYLERGDINNAWASMCSDLQKHEETRNHAGIDLGMMLLMSEQLSSVAEMKDFIEGFN